MSLATRLSVRSSTSSACCKKTYVLHKITETDAVSDAHQVSCSNKQQNIALISKQASKQIPCSLFFFLKKKKNRSRYYMLLLYRSDYSRIALCRLLQENYFQWMEYAASARLQAVQFMCPDRKNKVQSICITIKTEEE